jgi:trimeric autotransporter adhesin
MKKAIGAILLITVVFFSCRKSSVKPTTQTSDPTGTVLVSQGGTTTTAANDSLTNVTGYLRLQLAKDTINTDNILITFDPSAQTAYVPGADAPTLAGFGQVSLSSLSSNNIPLSIYTLPLTPKGVKIGLKVNSQADGVFTLNLKEIHSIPEAYDLWLIDGYRKDSLEIRYNNTYAFNIFKADTNSFGTNRFKLVIRTR